MKLVLTALVALAAAPAFASAPHCPPGYDNVWGACIEKGSGILNPIFNGHGAVAHEGRAPRSEREVYVGSRPHCPPGTINVWGACVYPRPWR